MEQLEMTDTLEPEQTVDQQDGITSCSIPLHVLTFFVEVHREITEPL